MICPNCGTETPDGMKFCRRCGAKLPESVEQVPPTTSGYPEPVDPIPPTVPGYPDPTGGPAPGGDYTTVPWGYQAGAQEPTASAGAYGDRFQTVQETAPQVQEYVPETTPLDPGPYQGDGPVFPGPSPQDQPAPEGKRRKSKGMIITAAVLGVLMCAFAGLSAYLYLTLDPELRDTKAALERANVQVTELTSQVNSLDAEVNSLNTNVDALNQELSDREDEIASLESENSQLQTERDSLKSENENLTATLEDQDASLADLSADAQSFRQICEQLYGKTVGWAANNFNSSDWLVIQKTTDGPREIVITANWTSGGTVSLNHSSNHCTAKFASDSYDTTVNVVITPSSPGVDVLTFTNSVDSKSFRVLVIVFD